MKRLVLALALLMVLSMGTMALAGVTQLGDRAISVNVSVSAYADVEVNGGIDFAITKLDAENTSSRSRVTVKTNAPVNVRFEENISRKLYELIGQANRVWRWDTTPESNGMHDNDNWIVSPNVIARPFEQFNANHQLHGPHGMVRIAPISQKGTHSFDVTMEATWRSKDRTGKALPWYLLPATEEVAGTIQILVEATETQ